MEENNRKGPGVFYAVVGVATLVVAIIGATFAYFSAQATSADKVQGGTNTELSTALTLNVDRQLFGEAESESYNNLVPAVIDVTTDGIKKVVDNKCMAGGYTGCHLYKITATSSQNVAHASVRLADLQTTATDYASWKFYLYKLDESGNVTIISDAKNTNHSFAAYDAESTSRVYTYSAGTPSGFDMHNNASLNGNTTYYLMVYLENKENVSQNPNETSATESGTGTYSGIITMDAAGGKVYAKFEAKVGN